MAHLTSTGKHVSPLLPDRCEAIQMAMHLGCEVRARISGKMRRITHVLTDGETVTLIYPDENKQPVRFYVREDSQIELQVILVRETEESHES